MGTIEDSQFSRKIDVYNNFGKLWLLDSKPILLAKYPKKVPIENSILFHPRYVNDSAKADVDFIKVKGLNQGRTLDIVLRSNAQLGNDSFDFINVKGVGAYGDDNLQVEQNSWFDLETKTFVPFESVMNKSLGRRWGLVDTYEAKREFGNNLFSDLGISQIVHGLLNTTPEQIFPFQGTSQLVRGIKTNVRCDDYLIIFDSTLQDRFINQADFAKIDAAFLEAQKSLVKQNKLLISVMGRISNNRYIDGSFTDMENYKIEFFHSQDKLLRYATTSIMDLISCAYLTMGANKGQLYNYLIQLESNSGLDLKAFIDFNPRIFMDKLIIKEEYEPFKGETHNFYNKLKPVLKEYFFSVD
jgi:hypothetical protein